jgi:CubicO group peptidase (beta-lactamase class C family)
MRFCLPSGTLESMRVFTAGALVALLGYSGMCWSFEAVPPEVKFDQARLAQIPLAMQKLEGADGEIAGAVTLVATRDRVVQVSATGMANAAHGQEMKPDALFWIASMTKPCTATSILMLQDEGKLSVDDPVANYVPELGQLKTPEGKAANITLRQLLTHTSGMALEAPSEDRQNAKTLADLMPVYAGLPMRFDPGSKWEYCQSGINALGRVVEVVSGKSLPEFLQERLFTPLGMEDTTFYPTEEQAARLATGYRREGGKLVEAPMRSMSGKAITSHEHYPAANGGLFSTAADYVRLCQMLLNDGSLDGREYLKPETARAMRTIQTGSLVTGFSPGNGWGLGVCVVRQPQGVTAMLSPGTFGHGGAWGTQAWIDPVKGVIYILMVQRADFANSDQSPVREAFQQAAASAMAQ